MEVLEQMRMLLREKAILFGQYEQETLRLDTDDLDAVDAVAGATVTSGALKQAVQYALEDAAE